MGANSARFRGTRDRIRPDLKPVIEFISRGTMIVMYLPPKFHMNDDDVWGIVGDVGAATLVLSTMNGLESAFAPVIVSEDRRKLFSHLARANPWWRAVTPGAEVLAI